MFMLKKSRAKIDLNFLRPVWIKNGKTQCSSEMGLTPCMSCVQIYCVLYVLHYYLLNSQL